MADELKKKFAWKKGDIKIKLPDRKSAQSEKASERFAWKQGDITIELPPEPFAALRGAGRPGRRTKDVDATNAYQQELERAYADFSDDLANELAEADEEDRDGIIAAAVAALLLVLTALGRKHLPDAVTLGLGDEAITPEAAQELAEALADNEQFLTESLGPDIERKVKDGLLDGDVLASIAAGSGAIALGGVLSSMAGRVANYAGEFWSTLQRARGEAAKEKGLKIAWVLDPTVKQHCGSCLAFGDKTYDSWDDLLASTGNVTPSDGTDCNGGCRCTLEFVD